MKLLALFLLPTLGLAQPKLDTVRLLSGKVKLLAPKQLSPMSDEMWTLKYQQRARPSLVLTDRNGEVNLIADLTQQAAEESQLADFKNYQIQELKKSHPDLTVLSDGVKTINGKTVAYFKFVTQAVDQKVFNYYFFTVVDGKILFFSFNCIQGLQKKWETTADQIVSSLQIN